MARAEFEAFMQVEQWTPERRAQFVRFTPNGDAAAIRREMSRPDGMIEVRRVDNPFWSTMVSA